MTESTTQSSAASPTSDNDATEALAHLARMSGTGSAFGANEYVAISPLAIVTLLIGFASALSIIIGLFLFIPAIGILFGILALRQIRNSNGTQGGVGFALGGIILCLLIGGGVTARQAMAASRDRADSRKCAEVIAKFGEEIQAQHFDAIYNDMTTDVFRGVFPSKQVHDTLLMFRANPMFGELKSVRWAGNAIDFEPIAGTDARFGYAMMLIKFEKLPDPARETIKLADRDGTWKIEAIPQMFRDPKTNHSGFKNQ